MCFFGTEQLQDQARQKLLSTTPCLEKQIQQQKDFLVVWRQLSLGLDPLELTVQMVVKHWEPEPGSSEIALSALNHLSSPNNHL